MHSCDALLARFRQPSLGIRASLGIRVSFVITHSSFVIYDEARFENGAVQLAVCSDGELLLSMVYGLWSVVCGLWI